MPELAFRWAPALVIGGAASVAYWLLRGWRYGGLPGFNEAGCGFLLERLKPLAQTAHKGGLLELRTISGG